MRLFSFRGKSVSPVIIYAAFDALMAEIEVNNAMYVREDQINARTITTFLGA